MPDCKEFNFNNKKIYVYDDAFSSQENFDIYAIISQLNFTRTNVDLSFNVNETNKKWICNLGQHDMLYQFTLDKYSKTIDFIPWEQVSDVRQYVNYSTSDTADLIHADCNTFQEGVYTILQYANYNWDPNWHGETIFYDSNSVDAIFTSTVKPGRVLVFDSVLMHSATTPSKIAEFPRFTIATKIIINKNEC